MIGILRVLVAGDLLRLVCEQVSWCWCA